MMCIVAHLLVLEATPAVVSLDDELGRKNVRELGTKAVAATRCFLVGVLQQKMTIHSESCFRPPGAVKVKNETPDHGHAIGATSPSFLIARDDARQGQATRGYR